MIINKGKRKEGEEASFNDRDGFYGPMHTGSLCFSHRRRPSTNTKLVNDQTLQGSIFDTPNFCLLSNKKDTHPS